MKPFFLFFHLFSTSLFAQNTLQNFTDSALLSVLIKQKAESGIVIVREVVTGQVVASSAFSSVSFNKKATYKKDSSLLSMPIEPGGLFIPIASSFLIDNHGVSLSDTVSIKGGQTIINGNLIMDSENHGYKIATLNDIVAISSNVGIAELFNSRKDIIEPSIYFATINNYVSSNIDVSNKSVNRLNIPFLSYGYGLKMKPNEILNFYTRIAQNDKTIFKQYETINKVRQMLENVTKNGTAKILFSDSKISFASKTATNLALVKNGYNSKQYYSAIVGFAPIDNPRFSCIVIIKCKPMSPEFYGSTVAGPVFKSIMLRANGF